ncbi:lactonase family protein [Aquirhabdus parva]|uniref:Lactonase family protein n=1 Tax=Aquirhabdus parva TaxID=2283318 RepID=A0A345P5T9_9GAMM|nr:lactonase family protein [Aquirhabdus parva]AXI02648.1 lactonase family protein [Aquirhabdus parva]
MYKNQKFLLLGLSLALSALSSASPFHEQTRLLVGGYNNAIASYVFNQSNGQIEQSTIVRTPAHNASWFTVDAERNRLFAVDEIGSKSTKPVGKVSGFKLLDPAKPLDKINTQPTLGDEPTFVVHSPDGHYVFVANYAVNPNTGASLVVLPIDQNGQLGAVTQQLVHQASHVNLERQASSHIHRVTLTPDGQYVFMMDLGGDRVYAYRYDAKSDPKHPLTPAKVPYTALPPGSGPRHLIFSADGHHAYLTLEMAGKLAVFDVLDGELKQRAIISLTPSDFKGKLGAGALHLSADGQFLYVSDRGKDNKILVYSVDPTTGLLSQIQRRSTEGQEPREFAISPDGHYLLVTNQFSNEIVTFKRDPSNGKLGASIQKVNVKAPSMLQFVPEK